MFGYIEGVNFKELEPMKYYAHPKTFKGDAKADARNKIYSGEWIGARKMDGYFTKFVKDEDGNIMLLTRNRNTQGEFSNKIDYLPHIRPYFEALPNGTCFLAEVYFPNNEGSNQVTKIFGSLVDKAIARQKDEKLSIYIFDVLAYDGVVYLDYKAVDRFFSLKYIKEEYTNPFVSYAEYYDGQNLWNMIQNVLADGGEGGVIIKKDSLYQPGKRSSKVSLKIKKELQDNIDCFFTGRISTPTRLYSGKEIETWPYWENIKTGELINRPMFDEYEAGESLEPVTKPYFYDWAGSLEIAVYDGNKVRPVGMISGLTDEIKANYKNYKGRVIEVTAMQLTEDKMFRHPKMVCFKDDKEAKDCLWEQIEQL